MVKPRTEIHFVEMILIWGKKSECKRQNNSFYEKNVRENVHDLGGRKSSYTEHGEC